MAQFNGLSFPRSFPNRAYKRVEQQILNDPYYRFQSFAEVAIAANLGIQIDVNRATVDDWLRLPGISIHQGRILVELVGAGVQFNCLEDLAAALGISSQGLQPLEPILYFCYYDPESLSNPQQINVNTASLEDLVQIPSLEPLAKKILHNREQQGDYRNLVDFQRRLALKGQLIAQLMHYLKF